MIRLDTLRDAAEQVCLMLDTSEGTYDHDAIAADAFTYQVQHDSRGRELCETAGYVMTATEDEFWAIVARHDLDITGALCA